MAAPYACKQEWLLNGYYAEVHMRVMNDDDDDELNITPPTPFAVPVASARPDQNAKEKGSQPGPGGPVAKR